MFRSRGDHHQGRRTHVCALYFTLSTVYYIMRWRFSCTLLHDSGYQWLCITIVGRCGVCVRVRVYECLTLMPFTWLCVLLTCPLSGMSIRMFVEYCPLLWRCFESFFFTKNSRKFSKSLQHILWAHLKRRTDIVPLFLSFHILSIK
jgi:hypothetical protein